MRVTVRVRRERERWWDGRSRRSVEGRPRRIARGGARGSVCRSTRCLAAARSRDSTGRATRERQHVHLRGARRDPGSVRAERRAAEGGERVPRAVRVHARGVGDGAGAAGRRRSRGAVLRRQHAVRQVQERLGDAARGPPRCVLRGGGHAPVAARGRPGFEPRRAPAVPGDGCRRDARGPGAGDGAGGPRARARRRRGVGRVRGTLRRDARAGDAGGDRGGDQRCCDGRREARFGGRARTPPDGRPGNRRERVRANFERLFRGGNL